MTKNYDYVFLSTHDLTQRSTVLLRPVDDSVIFQLTTSRRGRRGKIVWGGIRNAFNSRPHAEVDWMRTRSMQTRRTFNSRPHAEVDHPQKAKRKRIINFQLTTSRRGRRRANRQYGNPYYFQLTTSRRGRLTRRLRSLAKMIFQLTTSRRGRQFVEWYFSGNWIFQLTTSRRGRLYLRLKKKRQEDFQLTTSRRGRPGQNCPPIKKTIFQLTTSRRGRQCCRWFFFHPRTFNSRPHAEVDTSPVLQLQMLRLSTHDLTQRSTVDVRLPAEPFPLSTHDLTQRSTLCS